MRRAVVAAVLAMWMLAAVGFVVCGETDIENVLASIPSPSDYPDASCVVLLEERHVELCDDGTLITRVHGLLCPLTVEGLAEARRIETQYRSGIATIEVRVARTILPSGDIRDATAITDFEVAEGGSLRRSDTRTLRIGFPSVRVGCVTEFEVVERTNDAFSFQQLSGSYPLWNGIPVLKRVLEVSAPADRAIAWKIEGTVPVDVVEEVSGVRFEVGPTPAMELEPGMPLGGDVLPQITYSTYASWSEVADERRIALDDGISGDPSVVALVEQLTAACQTTDEIVNALFRFVQDEVSYLAVILGDGGWVPKAPATTLRDRQGDCKAQSALLIDMLRTAGIDAWFAFVATQSPLFTAYDGHPWWPDLINHVVVAVPEGDGTWKILDPSAYAVGDADNLRWSERMIWILDGEAGTPGTFYDAPPAEPEDHLLQVVTNAEIDERGDLMASSTIRATGIPSTPYRGVQAEVDEYLWWAYFMYRPSRVYRVSYPSPDVTDLLQTTDLDGATETRVEYFAPHAAHWDVDLVVDLPPAPILDLDPYSDLADSVVEDRRFIYEESPRIEEESIHLVLPEGFSFVPPEDVQVASPVSSYTATYDLQGNELTVHRVFRVDEQWIRPEDLERHMMVVLEMQADSQKQLEISH